VVEEEAPAIELTVDKGDTDLDAHFHRPRAPDDHPGPGAVLWRSRPLQEHDLAAQPGSDRHRDRHGRLGRLGLFDGLHRWWRLNSFVGGFSKVGLAGVDTSTMVETFSVGVAIPEIVFVAFQMTFACITTALVLGGVAERAKFWGVVLFAVLWPIAVYYPMAHMVWWWGGPIMASDPANAQALGWRWPHLVLRRARLRGRHRGPHQLGYRCSRWRADPRQTQGYKSEPIRPHNLTFTLIGTGLLWVGWVGFNAGSNLEANAYAGLALINTFVATAAGALSWGARRSGVQEEAQPARHGFGRCCGSCRDHACRRLRRSGRRNRARPRGWTDLPVRLLGSQEPAWL
jgi:hypothetical protein